MPGRRPSNVLIVKSDEHNARITSVAGHPFIRTPNIDRLAARGVVYDSAYCPSPLCAPSRTSYLCGRPVHQTQCYNNAMIGPSPTYPTYGALLSDEGVHTAYAGKVHASRPPAELGFSQMMTREPMDTVALGDGHVRREPLELRDTSDRVRACGVNESTFDGDDWAVGRALAFLDTARELPVPWTLEVDLLAPHFPHFATRELWDLYDGDLPEFGVEQPSAQHPYAADLRRHFDTAVFTEEWTRLHRRGYYARVTYVDRQLGRLVEKLEEVGELDRTMVVYTSDHGEMLGKFGMWFKSSLYEDAVRVPLIVAGPGFPAGTRVSTPVTQWDLQASIFAAAGVRRPTELLGSPLQEAIDPRRAVFAEYHGHGTRGSGYVVRQGRWKLIWCTRAPHQLFDLEADPDELRDVAGSEPEVVEELAARLRSEFCDPDAEQERAERFIQEQLAAIERLERPRMTADMQHR